jgi:hypothetical protein
MEQNAIRLQLAKDKIMGTNRIRQGIGTLSEKTVHAVLKHYFAPDEQMHEIPIENYIADIYTGTEIIEIQTAQLNKMREKLACFLPLYPVTIVHPIPRQKWLFWVDEETGAMSAKRKSPAKGTMYHAFSELYKIKTFLRDPNLKIRLVLIDMEEYRLLNGWSKDKKKGSTKLDRIPTEIVWEGEIGCLADYRQFVPYELTASFTVKDFALVAHIPKKIAQIAVHILHYMGVIHRIGKSGRSYLYEILE